MNEKLLKRGQLMYIFGAGLEYLISILVTGSYLATLTKKLGFSDSLTGILSSVISLGCLFQLLSILIRRSRVKSLVVFLSIINQLLFMLLYVIPVISISNISKTVIFVVFIFTAYLIYNIACPKKINWRMSLVDDRRRGRFTANKEIVSLFAGMTFSFAMGSMVDYFSAKGQWKIAFILSAIVIFVLMILHTVSMILSPEAEIEVPKKNMVASIREVLGNHQLLRVIFIFVLYNIASSLSLPFLGTYQITELAFSLKFVSTLSILSSVLRILISPFWGKYADMTSFIDLIQKCLILLGVSFLCVAFAVPSNGKIMMTLYFGFYGMAMGGINSSVTNLVFDFTSAQKRADALAICQAISGVTGFITTLIASALVSYIQKNNNYLLGINVYAQQAVATISLVIVIISILYIKFIFKRASKM